MNITIRSIIAVLALVSFFAVVLLTPWLRLFKFFWRFLRWLRNNPNPSLISSVIGLILLFGGVIGYVLGYGQGNEWVYKLIFVVGVVILLIINWGGPLRREEK